ncbi:MAG: glutathione synthase [Gammaproteobacteria bacterium]|jgi:glutathione synthase|nr:glutathione synthase [Gammaproteobacteria bacterium]HJL79782.1 glutathione synthase [Gammaproteobacteria bacterium]|tara:strand:+ start:8137 stop:9099 length:963 start_codon:yes stop_codon:yes gene_type:complete
MRINESNIMKLAVVMDPIERIKPEKDGTLDLLLSAQSFGYELTRFHTEQLRINDGKPLGIGRSITVNDDRDSWFTYGRENEHCLNDFDVILMRKDPPFDMEYIYSTYILDLAKMNGAKVINEPSAIRNLNEKVSITMFPSVTPPTLVTSNQNDLRDFINLQNKIVVKPLDGMGGRSIFIVEKGDQNTNTIFEEMTRNDKKTIMAQKYIPEIKDGDKRIHLVFGHHVGMALARVPSEGDHRGNLVMGATGEVRPLTERDQEICDAIGNTLLKAGVYFAGIDVIGDYLSEINITSPTGMREISKNSEVNVSDRFFEALHKLN